MLIEALRLAGEKVGAGRSPGRSIAVLNPYNGIVERFAALNKQPSKLARSLDGH